jgi:hypothetical protein
MRRGRFRETGKAALDVNGRLQLARQKRAKGIW